MRICKYELIIKGWQTIEIPSNYKILEVGICDNGNVHLIVAVNDNNPLIRVALDMKQIDEYIYEDNHTYIGSVETSEGDVFYVFEFK